MGGRKRRKPPRTCGCRPAGPHRDSCSEAEPSRRAAYEALSPAMQRRRHSVIRASILKCRSSAKIRRYVRIVRRVTYQDRVHLMFDSRCRSLSLAVARSTYDRRSALDRGSLAGSLAGPRARVPAVRARAASAGTSTRAAARAAARARAARMRGPRSRTRTSSPSCGLVSVSAVIFCTSSPVATPTRSSGA